MPKINLLILAVTTLFLTVACAEKPVKEKLLIAGSYWDSIAIVDKATKQIEWTYQLPEGAECNSVDILSDGKILFSYKNGARIINRDGKTVWDYNAIPEHAEVQTAKALPAGGFLIAVCGTPVQVIEFDTNGKLTKSVSYPLAVPNPHAQFRQVVKSRSGTYLIPVLADGSIHEIDATGKLLKTYPTGGTPFSVDELENRNLLVSGGDGHFFAEIDRESGKILKKTGTDSVSQVRMEFVAQVKRLPNGNTLVCDWLGHGKEASQTPQVFELDPENRLVWSFENKAEVKYISAVCPFSE